MALASEKGTHKDVDIMDFSRSNGSTAGSKLCSSVLQIFRKETAITTVSMGSFLPDFFNFLMLLKSSAPCSPRLSGFCHVAGGASRVQELKALN